MAYRRTRKYSAARIEAMARGKAKVRLEREAPDYPPALPNLRIRIIIERFDPGAAGVHIFDLWRTNRVDTYRVTVDGKPWGNAGLSAVLAGLRKATPRMLSERAV